MQCFIFPICKIQLQWFQDFILHGPLARYVKLQVAHAPGMPGTFSPPPLVSDPGMHHGTCVMHVPWCIPGSLTSGFLWSRWRGKRSRHSRRMCNPQFYVCGKRPIVTESFHLRQWSDAWCQGTNQQLNPAQSMAAAPWHTNCTTGSIIPGPLIEIDLLFHQYQTWYTIVTNKSKQHYCRNNDNQYFEQHVADN